MHIVLLTHYFPPEVNAPANRSFEHARVWQEAGYRVTVVTTAPSHPRGVVYPGHANRWTSREEVQGIEVIRIWTWLAANQGTMGRIISFSSYLLSVLLHLPVLPRGDVVLATSPQFFCGLSGWLLRRRSCPWVLEIRDLWPESIVAVGAMKRSLPIRLLEALERWAYVHADRVVAVTKGFIPHIASRRGRDDIAVVQNGVLPESLAAAPGAAEAFRAGHGLEGKFCAVYLGTHGMAHGLDHVLEAAALLQHRDDIRILLIGDGAEKDRLAAQREARGLANVLMLPQQPRAAIPAIWGATGAALVTLAKSDTFLSVLPSKMFEAMGTARPIVLAVEGEAKALMDEAGAGLAVPPEDPAALAAAIAALADDPARAAALGASGQRWFAQHADRRKLAMDLLALLEEAREAAR